MIKTPMNFTVMSQTDVPQGRNGKHKAIITQILSDLDQMKDGNAIKVPLKDLVESKEKVRSALNRAVRKGGRSVATASDENFLYVWNVTNGGRPAEVNSSMHSDVARGSRGPRDPAPDR